MLPAEFAALRKASGLTQAQVEIGTAMASGSLELYETGKLRLPREFRSVMTKFVNEARRKPPEHRDYIEPPKFPISQLREGLERTKEAVAQLVERASGLIVAMQVIENQVRRMEALDSGEGVISEIPRRNEEIARSQEPATSPRSELP